MKIPPQIRFYATKDDLLHVLLAIESLHKIKYIRTGWIHEGGGKEYQSAAALPDLGLASSESAVSCTSYLISAASEQIRFRDIGTNRQIVDQMINPETIEFNPGGLWASKVLLQGRFATASGTASSAGLMKIAGSTVRKGFEKIKAFYVGAQAAQRLDSGARLAGAVQSPPMLDLKRD